MAYNPYGKAPKGETAAGKAARQKKFYRFQRTDAQETGDQATTDKIYKKLGKKSPSVDASAVDKGILGGVASTFGLGGLGRLGKFAGAAGKAMRGARAAKSIGRAVDDYSPSMAKPKALPGRGQGAQKALSGGKGPKMAEGEKPMTMGGKKAPGSQNKPIYKRGGVAPRSGGKSTGMGKMKKSSGRMKKKKAA